VVEKIILDAHRHTHRIQLDTFKDSFSLRGAARTTVPPDPVGRDMELEPKSG
jgi:hypothetical protein